MKITKNHINVFINVPENTNIQFRKKEINVLKNVQNKLIIFNKINAQKIVIINMQILKKEIYVIMFANIIYKMKLNTVLNNVQNNTQKFKILLENIVFYIVHKHNTINIKILSNV